MKLKLKLLFTILMVGFSAAAQVNWNAYGLRYKIVSGDTLFYFPSNTIPVKNLSMYSRTQIDSIIQSGAANGVINAGTISFNSTTNVATITSPFTFRINGSSYTPTQTTVNLTDRDATKNRIDIITGTNVGLNGGYGFVTGTASTSPIVPPNPANTVVIAQIYRYASGSDLVIINDNSGYLPITGGDLFGGLKIKNGNDLFFDAANTTDDSGDIIWRDNTSGTPTEMTRLLSGTNGENSLRVMFDRDETKKYDVLHTGNAYTKTKTDSLLRLKQDTLGLIDKNNYRFDGYSAFKDTTGINAAAGDFVRINSTNILYIYRHSAVMTEINNDGAVWGTMSTDNGTTWGTPYQIFSDSYDDRNAIIGKTPNGNLIIIFRRYDAVGGTQIDVGYITSTDGVTWSSYTVIPAITGNVGAPFGKVFNRGANTYFVYYYSSTGPTLSVAQLYESTDNGTTWTFKSTIYNSSTLKLNEPFLLDLPNGKSIVWVRNEERVPNPSVANVSIYQYNSDDGVNFTFKGATNINNDVNISTYTPVFPFLDGNTLIVLAPQRNAASGTFGPSQQTTKMSIYINDYAAVFSNELGYTKKHSIERPYKNIGSFYGYPSAISVGSGKWAGIVGEYKRNDPALAIAGGNEKRGLYMFDFLKLTTSTELLFGVSKYPNTRVTKNPYNGGQDYVYSGQEQYMPEGTSNTIPKFSNGAIINSNYTDDGTNGGFGVPGTKTAKYEIDAIDVTGVKNILRLRNSTVTSRSWAFGINVNGYLELRDVTANAARYTLHSNGNLALGAFTPTAKLDIPAGTASTQTQPLKLGMSSVTLPTGVLGEVSFNNNVLAFVKTGTTRDPFAFASDLALKANLSGGNTLAGIQKLTNDLQLTSISSGIAGTDSLLVKKTSDNKVYKISPNYYATVASVALKSDDNTVVKLTGNQSVTGIKTLEDLTVTNTAQFTNGINSYSDIVLTNPVTSADLRLLRTNITGTKYIKFQNRNYTVADSADVAAIPTISSGTYTPTATLVLNATAITLTKAHYTRIGNQVTVTINYLGLDATSGGITFDVSLPIASNLASSDDLAGIATVNGTGSSAVTMSCSANTTSDRATIGGTQSGLTSATGSITFTYTII